MNIVCTRPYIQDMYMKLKVVEYVRDRLDSALSGTDWVNINHLDAIGKLADKFSVYRRCRELDGVVASSANDFERYQSLQNIRGRDETFLVACDSEWKAEDVAGDGPVQTHSRFILSWQFAFIKDKTLVEIVFVVKNPKDRLNLLDAISALYCLYSADPVGESLDVDKYRVFAVTEIGPDGEQTERVFKRKKEALAVSSHVRASTKWPKNIKYLPVCLLFHTALVDITAFSKVHLRHVLKRLISVHHGLISRTKIKLFTNLQARKYSHHKRQFPIALSVRDTLIHAPPGQKSLEDLGGAIGVPKVDIDESIKANMDGFLMNDPVQYFEYAATDAVVTLLYATALYGENVTPPMTLTSAAAKTLRNVIADYMGIDMKQWGEFDKIYRGLRRVKKGPVPSGSSMVPYIKAMDVEPINMPTQQVQYVASYAYHGGYNGCSTVGYYTCHTYDYDLKNAYPTAMCLVPDINWRKPLRYLQHNVRIQDIGARLFSNGSPLQLIYAKILKFRFPDSTAYPCIPVVVDGIPVYPLQYDSSADCCSDVPGVYITGPELFLAYKLHAEVEISELYGLRPLMHEGEKPVVSRSLARGVLSMVADRTQAKADAAAMGKKNYLCDTILKVMVNSCYGKVAQNVIEKKTWDAYTEEMTAMGASFITNPVSASLITAIVRCVLMAVQNQCVSMGYDVYSVTTDGFISSVPEDVLAEMDMYGFKALLYKARMYLTGGKSGKIWEVKHQQDDLLNFTTRGNVSLDLKGVMARNGAISGFRKKDKGSYQERLWLMDKVLARTAKIQYQTTDWVKFKDIVLGRKPDFDVVDSPMHRSMDYDIKRKPVRNSFTTVKPVINGTEYEIANFTTVPYLDVGEYKEYRSLEEWIVTDRKRSPSKALRTLYDWTELFFHRLEQKNRRKGSGPVSSRPDSVHPDKAVRSGRTKLSEADDGAGRKVVRKIIKCLYCHKAGVITIPLLAQDTNLFLKVLNKSGLCKRKFTKDNLKNYAKRERWPWAVVEAAEGRGEDNLKHFLAEQEPVLGQLLALQADEPGHEG